MNRLRPSPARQRGVALAVALILLVVLTLLALSGVRLSSMELRMSLNDQLRVASFENAQSMVDTTIRSFNNTPVLAAGVVLCARDNTSTGGDCSTVRNSLTTTLSGNTTYADLFNNGYINVVIRSIPPLNADPPVGTGYSLDKFDAAYLRVEGVYDQNALGLGQAQVNEGVAIVYGSGGEITTKTGSDAGTQFSGS